MLKTDSTPKEGLSAIQELAELRKSFNLAAIDRFVAGGGKAIWGGNSWETPFVYACDTLPVPMNLLWRSESRVAENVGERHFQIPPEFCSMVKVMIGRMHLRNPDPIRKVLYFGSCCEPIVNVLELAKPDGYDVYCIENVTAYQEEDKRPAVIAFLVRELEKVMAWLSGGVPVDEARLKAELLRKNEVSRKLRRVLELRVKAPQLLDSAATMQLILGANHYFGQPERYLAVMDRLAAELEAVAQEVEARTCIPVVFAGGGGSGNNVLSAIAECGGAVVGWVAAGTEEYRTDVPPLEAIAHYLLDAQMRGELGEGAGTSATLRRHRVEAIVRQTGAKGVISVAITGCPYASVVQKIERDHFQSLGIPFIGLETNVHGEGLAEEQKMRVQAFFEMLRA